MGNGYNQHLHRQNPTFLPIFIFCTRPSIRDVSLRKSAPLSPNTGCMKRSNRIVGSPVSHKFNITKNSIRYFKLKKMFSGKNPTGTGCGRNRTSRTKNGDGKEKSGSINIETLDLPLPVNVRKRVPKQSDKGDGDTLWERRLRGAARKSLQLQLNHNTV